MTTAEIYILIAELDTRVRARGRHTREGQAYFTALYDLYPTIASAIKNTKYDPFYLDENIYVFIEHLKKCLRDFTCEE